jgi:hypothetical protein
MRIPTVSLVREGALQRLVPARVGLALSSGGRHLSALTLVLELPPLRRHSRPCTTRTDPFELLGVNRSASDAEIKAKYLELAKKHHPDTGADHAAFTDISAAYQMLSDPKTRAEMERDPKAEARAAAAAALAQAEAGRIVDAMDLVLSALSSRVGAASLSAQPPLHEACSALLALCAKHAHVPQLHGRTKQLWASLEANDAIDARACNAWFSLCIRAGQIKDGMSAFRRAEACGFEQSLQMRNYIRQARRYKASLEKSGVK